MAGQKKKKSSRSSVATEETDRNPRWSVFQRGLKAKAHQTTLCKPKQKPKPLPECMQATSVPSQTRRRARRTDSPAAAAQPLFLSCSCRALQAAPPETAPATARPRRWHPPPTTGDHRVRRPRRCGGLGLPRLGTPASTLTRHYPKTVPWGSRALALVPHFRAAPAGLASSSSAF
jgi:hypothetical protein